MMCVFHPQWKTHYEKAANIIGKEGKSVLYDLSDTCQPMIGRLMAVSWPISRSTVTVSCSSAVSWSTSSLLVHISADKQPTNDQLRADLQPIFSQLTVKCWRVSAVSWPTVGRRTADMCWLITKYTFTNKEYNSTNQLTKVKFYPFLHLSIPLSPAYPYCAQTVFEH